MTAKWTPWLRPGENVSIILEQFQKYLDSEEMLQLKIKGKEIGL